MILVKIILTWGVCPLSLIFGYNSLMAEKLKEEKALATVTLYNGILIIIVVVLLGCRLLFFWIWQDREEVRSSSGVICVTYEFLTHERVEYYEPINSLLYKKIDNIQEYLDITDESNNEVVDEPGQ